MPLTRAEYELLAAFRYTLRRFLAFSDEAAGSVGLTQQQYQALLAVRAYRAENLMTIGDLAEELMIKHHSAVGMVNRLEELGMVRRERSAQDARKVGVRLTNAGMRVFDRLASMHRSELRRVGPDLGRLMDHFGRPPGEPRSRLAGRKARSR